MVPLWIIRDPSAVRRRTPSEEVDFRPRNTETEAPESTRNSVRKDVFQEQERITAHLSFKLRLRE